MSQRDARDPYLGLNAHIREQAQGQLPAWRLTGKVLNVAPLIVRAGGMDLDREDLLVAQHLIPGWRETLTGVSCPMSADLPSQTLTGTCSIVHEPLAVGDVVLLIPDEEGQTYYLIEKLVVP